MKATKTSFLTTSLAIAGLALWGLGCAGAASESADMGGAPRQISNPGDQEPMPDPNDPNNPVNEGWSWFQLSPDDSTSMASAQLLKVQGQGYGGYGYEPYGTGFGIHAHEIVNYYDPPATLRQDEELTRTWTTGDGLIIGVDAERGTASDNESETLEMVLHVYAPQVDVEERRPWTLHLCVDVSGSMGGEKIAYTRNALQMLVDHLQPGDRISLTTFESSGRIVFETLDAAENEERIRSAIAALEAGGSTNMIEGLDLAYAEAQAVYDPTTINRVLVFSDGNANVGDTDVETFAGLTRINNQEGIYLSGVGVGFDYAVERMDALTDAGKGAHVFLPDANEVAVIFGTMVRKLVEVTADEVSIEVQLPAGFELEQFSGEEVSTDPNLRVPNVVLAAGDDMTVLSTFATPEREDFDGDVIITVRYRPLSSGEQITFEQRLPIRDILSDGGKLLQRTRLVNDYARWATGSTHVDVAQLHEEVTSFEPQDDGLAEIACMIGYLSGYGMAPEDPASCTAQFPDYWGEGCDMYPQCAMGHACSAMPSVAVHGAWMLPLLVGLAMVGRKRRSISKP